MSRLPQTAPRLVQNPHGIYEIRWVEQGRTKRLSTRTRSLRDAGLVLAEWADKSSRPVPPQGSTRVGPILEAWWEAHAHDRPSAAHTQGYIRLLKESLGFLEAANLTHADLETHCRKRRTGRIGSRPVGDGTLRHELGILQRALRYAAERKLIRLDELPKITLPPEPPPREAYLELEEIDRLLTTAARLRKGMRLSRIERFLWIALHTGARKESIVRLEWSRVDFTRRLIDFREPGRVATKKRRTVVPISDALLPVLQRAYQERKGDYVLDMTGSIRTNFNRVVERAGLEGVTPHTLRHTFASQAVMSGVPIAEVARVLGNTIAVCEKTYAKYRPDYLVGAVNQAYGGRTFTFAEGAPA